MPRHDMLHNCKHVSQTPLFRVQLESLDPLELQEKMVLVVFVETMEPLEEKESKDQQDHLVVQETKGTLEKMDQQSVKLLSFQWQIFVFLKQQ